MKFRIISALLGAASTVSIDKLQELQDTQLIQEATGQAESLKDTCKEWHAIEESSLVELGVDNGIPVDSA